MFWSANGSSGSVGFSCLWYQSNAFHHKCNQNSQLLIHFTPEISQMKIITTNIGWTLLSKHPVECEMENCGSYFYTDKRFLRCCSPVRTLFPSLALPFHPKGTDVRSVPLIVWCGTSQFQQHIATARCLPKLPHRSCAIGISNLQTKTLQLFDHRCF